MTSKKFEDSLGAPDISVTLALDEAEVFPAEWVKGLIAQGILAGFVPLDLGGTLDAFPEAAERMRAVARRDLTAAIAVGQCFLGAIPVWLAGSSDQKKRAARVLLEGGAMALALTEEAHGSDILASDVVAERDGDGFRLSGEKWLINNATRSRALSVFARTSPEGGIGGFTLFLVEKPRLNVSEYSHLPKIHTHGIRGADISGIRFEQCRLSAGDALGSVGSGMDVALKALQLTRTGCAAFSLGAADAALAEVLAFARERKLYGATVLDIPQARAALAGCIADRRVCEVVATAALRAVHAAPEQLSLWSAAVKYFVPTTVDALLRELAVVYGARHYLRRTLFQKVLRDHAVVPLFDGSTAVNLESIGLQLPRLFSPRGRAEASERGAVVKVMFDVEAPLPRFEPERLALMNAGRDDVLHEVEDASLADAARALGEMDRAAAKRSVEQFELARRYCVRFAAACCRLMHAHSPRWLDADALALCLARLEGGRLNADYALSTATPSPFGRGLG